MTRDARDSGARSASPEKSFARGRRGGGHVRRHCSSGRRPARACKGEERFAMLGCVLAGAGDTTKTELDALGEQVRDRYRVIVVDTWSNVRACHRPVAHTVPFAQHRLREEHEVLAEHSAFVLAFGERNEHPDEMRPADLPAVHGPKAELRASVGDEEPGATAESGDFTVFAVPSDVMKNTVTSLVAIVQTGASMPRTRHELASTCFTCRPRTCSTAGAHARLDEQFAKPSSAHPRRDQVGNQAEQSRAEHVRGHAVGSEAHVVSPHPTQRAPCIRISCTSELVAGHREPHGAAAARREFEVSNAAAGAGRRPRLAHASGRKHHALVRLVTRLASRGSTRGRLAGTRAGSIGRWRFVGVREF